MGGTRARRGRYNAAMHQPDSAAPRPTIRHGDPRLARRLAAALKGEVLFDPVSRGQYATDASIYQIEPIGVVVPRDADDVAAAIAIAAEEGVPLLPRGGGTSQCGQTVGEALVLDCSKHMNRMVALDAGNRRAVVQPGLVLDRLNAQLRPHGLFFPVDVSTGNRATIGGMAGNNSCGARSLRYGTMRDNVAAIDALLPDGTALDFGWVPANLDGQSARLAEMVQNLRRLHAGIADEIEARFPKLMRRVGGYNLDSIDPAGHNLAHLLVGSEGTLGFFRSVTLDLQPLPGHKVLGVCHFPSFHAAMANTRHIVALGPTAVELVDSTMIALSRDIAQFRPVVERFVRGEPDALLLVEFAGDDAADNLRRLRMLVELMGELGFPGAVVEATDPAFQAQVWEVRKQGLNIMMSMKGDGKPVSFIEDCAVRLEDLADYTARLTEVFARHGTTGTWYAHASVGCLHVRPILNMKDPADVAKMRAIAEEAFAMVREYKGSHSGEHGDGLVRSEFHRPMFGDRLVESFAEVKRLFDPAGLMNPGKIVDPPKMDDRALFRFKPGYAAEVPETLFDWSDWGGFDRAVEMCNNNGACRKPAGGVMCPSFRATGDERHLTRGRANALRLALSGQLGAGALTSDALWATLELCLSCKACRRECPTGVDMARMKAEVAHQRREAGKGRDLRARLLAGLPAWAPWAAPFGALLNLRDRAPALARLSERLLGFAARRPLPRWHPDPFRETTDRAPVGDGKDVVLFADCTNRWFEPDTLRAAKAVLEAAGMRVHLPRALDGNRPLCCGRTWLAAGDGERARAELRRTAEALRVFTAEGVPVIGLEPSCLLTFRDELPALLDDRPARNLARRAVLLEEWLDAEHQAGRLDLPLAALPGTRAVLHGHCHQKAFGLLPATERVLRLIPGLEVETIESTCCGMAGSFGYEAEHYETAMAIGEQSVLPQMRAAPEDAVVIAAGTSCRCQIRDGADRLAVHPAELLRRALAARGLATP